ncbi:helix-turn-helix domain-containing protein [Pseudonocardia aurantiaca]|uniref:Helix-turn-helix domain-containing protein n=1 Tax=Pseudonocardia aurantiaca TaxID=75290 RepID=A0ABW4FTD5_9PSEU
MTSRQGRTAQKATPADAPASTRRLYRIAEATQMLSLSRTVIYEQIRSGRLRSVVQGRTRLIPADAIADYVALLYSESGHDNAGAS